MKYRKLGRTGISVSELGIGCEGFISKTPEECRQMVNFAIENGVNFFDMYTSAPDARENIGAALSELPREKFVIQGHLCSFWRDGQYERSRKLDEVKSGFEDLLRLMKLDFVDIGMIHFIDELADYHVAIEGEIMDYVRRLKASGVVRHIGLSTHNPDIVSLAAETGEIDVIMLSVNPAYDMLPPSEDINPLFEADTFKRVYCGIDPKREAIYKRCEALGVALTVMKPFAGGLLFDERQSPFGRSMTAAQCIAYCLDRPAVASVLAGMASVEQISDCMKYFSATSDELDYGEILAGATTSSFDGHCMYCGHCAPCSSKIEIAKVNKYADLVLAQGFVPETLQNHYDLLEFHASDCIECGQCEARCPFAVKIINKMKQTAQLFGK